MLDDSGLPKKGTKSVGVARQYCGQLGKTDNCQVGVFATLANGKLSTIIDKRLYLPKEWTNDKERCIEAGIPEEHYKQHKTKNELARELIESARANGITYEWIGFDAAYGRDRDFLIEIDRAGEVFMADIPGDMYVYLEDPEPYEKNYKYKGEEKTKLCTDVVKIKVKDILTGLSEKDWQTVELRASSIGPLTVELYSSRVWVWDEKDTTAHCFHLVLRREIDNPNEVKYSLSNAHEATPLQKLGYMQGQRYWVERPFQDGKTLVGMGDYQCRSWNGWHKHMTMVMLALLFMLEERHRHTEAIPLLSCGDIQKLLCVLLPKRDITEEEVFQQLEDRHDKRTQAIESKKRRRSLGQAMAP